MVSELYFDACDSVVLATNKYGSHMLYQTT